MSTDRPRTGTRQWGYMPGGITSVILYGIEGRVVILETVSDAVEDYPKRSFGQRSPWPWCLEELLEVR